MWLCVLTGVIGGVIDWSGVGPNAFRDRIAAIFYLASALGWTQNLGIAAWEVQMHHALSPGWRNFWSAASVAPVFFWVFAMGPAWNSLGKIGRLSFRGGRGGGAVARSGPGGAGGAPTSMDRINGKLLGWTIGVALATPLAMPSAYGSILQHINSGATDIALAFAGAVSHFFGWS